MASLKTENEQERSQAISYAILLTFICLALAILLGRSNKALPKAEKRAILNENEELRAGRDSLVGWRTKMEAIYVNLESKPDAAKKDIADLKNSVEGKTSEAALLVQSSLQTLEQSQRNAMLARAGNSKIKLDSLTQAYELLKADYTYNLDKFRHYVTKVDKAGADCQTGMPDPPDMKPDR